MDYKTIIVTEKQINSIPKSSFKYGTWQSNYFIPVSDCVYHKAENLYTIGVMGKCSAETIAKYLKVNCCNILNNNTKEIEYCEFIKLGNF